jgi:hypothetical protein
MAGKRPGDRRIRQIPSIGQVQHPVKGTVVPIYFRLGRNAIVGDQREGPAERRIGLVDRRQQKRRIHRLAKRISSDLEQWVTKNGGTFFSGYLKEKFLHEPVAMQKVQCKAIDKEGIDLIAEGKDWIAFWNKRSSWGGAATKRKKKRRSTDK